MSWEKRNGGGRYYTRAKRVDGRVVREYVGAGEKGAAAAKADADRRAQQAAAKKALRAQEAEFDRADASLAALEKACKLMLEATLLAAGWHQHDRGMWRMSRR
jgi:hypothetical protein